MKVLKKIFSCLISIIVVIVLVVSLVVIGANIKGKSSGKNVPNLFGYMGAVVQTASMEPTINVDDFILCKMVDADTTVKEGDIVSFIDYGTNENGEKIQIVKTHRVCQIVSVDGIDRIQTWGDNRNPDSEGYCPQADQQEQAAFLIKDDIVAVYTTTVPVVGSVISFIKKPLGFVLCIVLPLLLYIIYEAYKLIKLILENNKQKVLEEAKNAQPSDDVKDAIIQEYLKSVAKDGESSSEASSGDDKTE